MRVGYGADDVGSFVMRRLPRRVSCAYHASLNESPDPMTRSSVLLGCIADDFTGATDLANTLVRGGMRAVQLIGVPGAATPVPDADAIVIALKSRTAPVADAVAWSRAALAWLRSVGAQQIFFKYCSTFDSTDAGNIGPVADALLDDLGVDFTIACPAFPENGRTIYCGHLFVGDRLLSDSSMRNHPLTPMADADLVRVLGRQTRGKVGLVPFSVVDKGAAAVAGAHERLRKSGHAYAIVDALSNAHLHHMAEAAANLPLVTGGSGLALGLPANFERTHAFKRNAQADRLPAIAGATAVISGSCSAATLRQLADMRAGHPVFAVDAIQLAAGRDVVGEALAWAKGKLGVLPVLISASAPPSEVARVQSELGRERASVLVEDALARIAQGLVVAGVRKLVVAGGETSGAVVQKLGVTALRIGPQIDPGVPWTMSLGEPVLALALKSGNFGADDFFVKAFRVLEV